MESYIPLVKAIIISTMLTWGTTSVVITDQYILKENIIENQKSGKEEKTYQVFDLKKKIFYNIDPKMKFKSILSKDSIDGSKIHVSNGRSSDTYYVLNSSTVKEDFGEYKCKKEIKEIQQMPGEIKYEDQSYFAKIPWLDAAIDTEEKRTFAGFDRQEYSPYHYLVYEYIQYPNMSPSDQVLRIIEKSEVDTSFIHTLLSLPPGKN